MAQNEDDAAQRHHDMRWATITKMIDTTQKMIDVKMRLADTMVGNAGMGDELRMSVFKMVPSTNRRTDDTLSNVDSGLGVATVTKTGGTSMNDDDNFVTGSLLTNNNCLIGLVLN